MTLKKMIAVIGGGPAGLIAAETAAAAGLQVTIYDRMPSLGRKFLMAGRGGLNLTHNEAAEAFVTRYGPASPWLAPMIEAYPPSVMRSWAEGLGEPTFVGSSGRIFPKSFKASPLLRAWLRRLGALGVGVRLRHCFEGWDGDGRLVFNTPDGMVDVAPDATILALGGASWPRLGSDGGWVAPLRDRSIDVIALRPANCGFTVDWSAHLRERFAGAPLKSIAATFGDNTVRGEALITATGIEGGAIYALSGSLRDALDADGQAELILDLKPDVAMPELVQRLPRPRKRQSSAVFLRKSVGLSPVAIALLREAGPLPVDPPALAHRIKSLALRLTATTGIARAISTAGGVSHGALDEMLMLRTLPGTFVAGEMLDWEAPTGGYLLQACFSTGVAAARGAIDWLA